MLAAACLVALAGTAWGDRKSDARVDAAMAKVRELFERHDLAGARDLLLETYAATPRPDLLFALGQVELNLGNYDAAIDYYQRFLATHPSSSEAAVAQQAIGAAREGAARAAAPPPPAPTPPPPPPPPRLERDWDRTNTMLVAIGGGVAVVGAGLALYGYELGTDRSGTLGDYAARVDRSTKLQWIGAGVSVGGAVVAAAALIRWRVRRVVVVPEASADSVSMVAVTRW